SQAIEVFMLVKANDAQIKAVNDSLAADRRIKSFRFVTKDEAYKRFENNFGKDQPSLVESTSPDILPTSFIVTPMNAKQASTLESVYEAMPGVDNVAFGAESIRRSFGLFRTFRSIFVVSSILLLISSVALVVIAIRLATVARRREIEVMKLVGASNTFIRVPFLLEGMFQGVIGALIAVPSVLWPLRTALNGAAKDSSVFIQAVSLTDAIPTAILLFASAVIVGILGSAIGLWRFLDV
ncbi:MAG: permease-like cell division protein FtsX, partial [Acidimicrobiia bacterium]